MPRLRIHARDTKRIGVSLRQETSEEFDQIIIGRVKADALDRLVAWFCAQDRNLRNLILDNPDDEMKAVIALKLLERMARQSPKAQPVPGLGPQPQGGHPIPPAEAHELDTLIQAAQRDADSLAPPTKKETPHPRPKRHA